MTPEEKKVLQEIAHGWEKEMFDALEVLMNEPSSTLDDLATLAFEKAILDRVAPLDPQVFHARKQLYSEVYLGTRDDADLYYRIIYCVEIGIFGLKKRHSVISGWAGQAVGVFHQITFGKCHLMKLLNSDKIEEEYISFLEKIKFLCLQELEKRDFSLPERIFTIGEKGLFHGIPVEFEGCTPDGLIFLKPTNKSTFREDHNKLFDYREKSTFGEGISPIDFHKHFVTQ